MQFMRVSAPLLLPLLRLRAQGEVLARVFLTPGEHSIAEIARATSLSEATVLREVSRLIETGFVTERRQQGRPRLNPATSQFTALLALTVGPAHLLRERLAEVRGLDPLPKSRSPVEVNRVPGGHIAWVR